ncbi:amino acid ABC transporter permease [Mesorhizobium sp. WSM3860]|uniref:amino acid ABC transporter permease n=1 Tax=Mesorhizobium sp. WSM3860 TaxID=2029403 RepID=UPI000BAF17E2|nr:amino acid ABC transporter permease [Mesorhizobium sp. WSM3860]PBC03693.1 amino acid ABC transporter [Mesorhizobium sp. WSM3860]
MNETFTALSVSDLWFVLYGALGTIALTAVSLAAGTVLAIIAGVGRASDKAYVAVPLGVLADVVRSVPVIIQMILANSVLSLSGLKTPPFVTGIIVLSLYMMAYGGELVRGGIQSVPLPTRKAARSLGMSLVQDFVYVTFPIGFRTILPSSVGLVGGLIKDTSLAAVLGYIELLRTSQILINRTQEPLLILTGVGVAYFALCFPLTAWVDHFEGKIRR